jgi:DNA-directed RNA polymerase subunit RPC12/RpoP
MAKRMFKCFECGKIYDDEARALKCHNAPIQKIIENERAGKPKFLGR